MASKNIWIEANSFLGNAILNAKQPPYGYGLEHVFDENSEKYYTIIFKGDKRYAYEEREDGSLIYNY